MTAFVLDEAGIERARECAAARAAAAETMRARLAAAAAGEVVDDVTAVALLLSPAVETEALVAAARARRPPGGPRLETFSPLYLTNECDAECRMCGMRGDNAALRRETADAATVEDQLDILHRRGMRGVAILTGEYRHGARRRAMIERAAAAVRAAVRRGFAHVLVNIGALEVEEYASLLAGIPRQPDGRVRPQLTMCTFQESYRPATYARFMGTSQDNPRSDFLRRVQNFDRACDAGLWSVNPGILLGLDRDVAFETLALLAHVRHLRERKLRVYVSLPRLRRASGTSLPRGIGDELLTRIVAALVLAAPDARIVISTREPAAVQERLLPLIAVLTPGSPGVAPYTLSGARFDLERSQFEVLDRRPFEAILGEVVARGATVQCWEPAVPG